MSLIVVRSFEVAIEAHLLKGKIESEGIDCFIFDEHMVTTNPLWSYSIGGIKLKVNEADYEEAMLIVNDFFNSPVINENNEVLKCPNCESTELYVGFKSFKSFGGVVSAIFTFLMTLYPVHYNSVYKCKKCNHEFMESTYNRNSE